MSRGEAMIHDLLHPPKVLHRDGQLLWCSLDPRTSQQFSFSFIQAYSFPKGLTPQAEHESYLNQSNRMQLFTAPFLPPDSNDVFCHRLGLCRACSTSTGVTMLPFSLER